MRQVGLVIAGIVISSWTALPAAAQDDEDFAQGLARRGFTDLAEDVYKDIKRRGGSGADFGLLSVRVTALTGIGEPQERIQEARRVLKIIQKWIDQHPNHQRRVEAFGLLSEVHQLIGKTYMFIGDVSKADSAFRDAIGACRNLMSDLERKLNNLQGGGPEAERMGLHLMFAKYNYLAAEFYRLDALKDEKGKFKSFEGELPALEKFFENFMWDYENYLLAMDASTYMGRIYQTMAQMAAAAGAFKQAEDYWRKCFVWIGRAKGPFRDPDFREDPEVREVGLRGFYYEMAAKIQYGNLLRKQAGPYKRQYNGAIELGREALRLAPGARKSQWGTRILLELAKAHMAMGEADKAKAITNELLQRRDPRIRRLVNQIFGEYAGLLSPKDKFALAEEMYTRQSYFGAIKQYQELLAELPPGNELVSRCWYRIGMGYYLTGRHFEAILALDKFLESQPSGDEMKEAASRKARALRALAKLTGDAQIKQQRQEWDAWMARKGLMAEEELRGRAIGLERKEKFEEAIAEWEKLAKKGSSDMKAEALARIGYNRYFIAYFKAEEDPEAAKPIYKQALKDFNDHLDFVRSLEGGVPGTMTDDVSSSFFFGTRVYVRVFQDWEGALKFSRDMMDLVGAAAKPRHVMSVLEFRTEALVNSGRAEEAEGEFFNLKKIYDEKKVGLKSYQNGLAMLAESFENAAARVKGKDPEKHDKYFAKAAKYRKLYVEVSGGGESDYDSLKTMAGTFYDTAMADSEEGDESGARTNFKEARTLYNDLLHNFSDQIKQDSRKSGTDLNYIIRFRVARCYFGEGDYEAANQLVDELLKEEDDLDVVELKGDIQRAMAKRNRTPSKREEHFSQAARYYGEAAAKFKRIRGQGAEFEVAYFRNLYKWCSSLYEFSEGRERLERFFKQVELSGGTEEWEEDGGEWGEKLLDVKEVVDAQNPKD